MLHKYVVCMSPEFIYVRSEDSDVSDFMLGFKSWCYNNNLTTCWINRVPGYEFGAWRLSRDLLSQVNNYLLTMVARNDMGVQASYPCSPIWDMMPCFVCGQPTSLHCNNGCNFEWQFVNAVQDNRHVETIADRTALQLPIGRQKHKLRENGTRKCARCNNIVGNEVSTCKTCSKIYCRPCVIHRKYFGVSITEGGEDHIWSCDKCVETERESRKASVAN